MKTGIFILEDLVYLQGGIFKMKPKISIITPVLNEEKEIKNFLSYISNLINNNEILLESIIIDGGSTDNTVKIINKFIKNNNKIILLKLPDNIKPSRAIQMNYGSDYAKSDILLFLHIDTRLPENAVSLILKVILEGYYGGAFSIRFQPKNLRMQLVEFLDRMLIKITGNFFGDQAIFIKKDFFIKIGKYPDVKLMEDLIVSDKLKKSKNYVILKDYAITSSRRFYEKGILKQLFLNIYLFNLFRLGVNPDKLYIKYEKKHKKQF